MKFYELKGTITLIEPFTINIPNSNRFPTTVSGEPMIPASTIRGWLRYASYRSLIELFKTNGRVFNVHEHYMLAKGIDTNDLIKTSRATQIGANTSVRNLNPMLDLYGRWGLAGSLGVGNGVAPRSALVRQPNSSRGHIVDRFENILDYLSAEDAKLMSELIQNDSDMAPEIKGLKQRVRTLANERNQLPKDSPLRESTQAQIDLLNKEIEQHKEEKVGAKETIRRVNFGENMLAAGTEVQHKMKLAHHSDTSLQFLLWTISKLPFFRIGSMAEYNHGVAHPMWEITEHTFSNVGGKSIGHVGWEESGFVCSGIMNDLELVEFEKMLLSADFNFNYYG